MKRPTKICVSSLVLEVTRRCNMACPHCLRGDAQELDIDSKVLNWVAKYVEAGSVTFTGGEPSLNIKAIQRYFALAEKYGNMPYSFYVATNGKENQEELAITLLKSYRKMSEPEFCELNFSRDAYHEDLTKKREATKVFSGLSFFNEQGQTHAPYDTDRWVQRSGRAAYNNIGDREPYTSPNILDYWNIEFTGNGDAMMETLYVAVNGNIANNCDLSYDVIDANSPCKVQNLIGELKRIYDETE